MHAGDRKYGSHKNFIFIAPQEFFLEILNVKASYDTFSKISSFLCQLYGLKSTSYLWDFLLINGGFT